MTLPKKTRQNLKSSSGQIIVLFLLILVVGLAIVLSVASRTVTDIRITTTSDESSRAYFAAEAAIEEALKKVSSSGAGTFTLNFSSLNNSTATVEITEDTSVAEFVYPTVIPPDGVAQIALMTPFNPPSQANLNNGEWLGGTALTFLWGDAVSGVPPNTAIEISIVYATRSGPINWFIETGNIRKVVFDNVSSRSTGACFSSVVTPPNVPLQTTGFSFTPEYQATLTILSGSGCTGVNPPPNSKPVMARVRMLYNGSPLAVRGVGADLPPQGFTIDSSGQTPSGVTRRIEVTRLYPSVPSLFDYVLFSGGSDLKK